MEKYLEGEELTIDEIKAGVRQLTVNNEAYPVFCGSAFKNRGVQPMLDAVIDYLPSPLDVPPMIGHDPKDEEVELTRKPSKDEPFSALAFKVAAHPFYGQLTYIRVYSGVASLFTVSWRTPALISSIVSSSPSRYFSMSSSEASATASTSSLRYCSARSLSSSGISRVSYSAPMVTSPLASPGHT